MSLRVMAGVLFVLATADGVMGALPVPTRQPLVRAVDLNLGEQQEIVLSDGRKVRVRLVDLHEARDGVRSAVREARVKVDLNGQTVTLASAMYRLPMTAGGVQIDCPVTKGLTINDNAAPWGLDKDARLRLWPAGSPWLAPGTFVFPAVNMQLFSSDTQMANEPTFVDAGEVPAQRKIYYHYGLDFGGAEGLVDVVSATDGLIVSVGKERLPGYEDTPVEPRYDVVYVLDDRGWYYRYSHLHTIDPALRPGGRIKMAQRIGVLGKEGASGGWSHLHFAISSRQPSGKWGTQEAYAFIWEAYLRQYSPKVIAVARPHHLAWTGQKVTLDATRSWSLAGRIDRCDWTFSDGTTAAGPAADRVYDRPGTYSEILKVTDSAGRTDYDFAVVQVIDKAHPEQLPPTIHAAYAPTMNVHPGDKVTFKVRTFRTTAGSETWDFGDGTPPVTVRSDGNVKPLAKDGYAVTEHRYAAPGDYLVRVRRTNDNAQTATARLHVRVEPSP